MPNLTIGLPVFNAMPFLEESLESLLRQTDGDFEILAIDDGSTDSGPEYLRSVRDSRLRVIAQANRGLTFTLNRMLREVSTPWLMRHDADDIALPDRVAVLRRSIQQFPDAGMFYSDARYYQNGSSVGTFRTTRATPDKLRQITNRGYLLAMAHPTVTLNVEKAIALGGYRFNLHIEDVDLWWRMALSYDIHYLPEVSCYVRHSEESASSVNLEAQSVNTIYVQYLLLSHLYGWPALAYECVRDHLARSIDRSRLACREEMRRANIAYSQKQYTKGCRHLGKAAMAHPFYFTKRVLYEFYPEDVVFNGEEPLKFLRQRDVLWPKVESPTTSVQAEAAMTGDGEPIGCAGQPNV
jgi:glycosyltransferase involved in cell wall biosynthesis